MSNVNDLLSRYARPPAPTTVEHAVTEHESVRALLGDSEYATFLQGSYKNDTALWDINDVDVVAVARGVFSSHYTQRAATHMISWDEIFARIEQKLQMDERYRGRWTREDKCIRLNAEVKIDIVPAVHLDDPDQDPIAIFSFESQTERRNWPRNHYAAGVKKSARTNGAYKQTVRLMKRWARCWFGGRKVAPSYYIECAVHAVPDSRFTGNLSQDFQQVGSCLAQLTYASTLARIAGDGDLLVASEWDAERFLEFKETLSRVLPLAIAASTSASEQRARELWISTFNGQAPT